MAVEASPRRGPGEVVVIPRRSFYAVIFAVAVLLLATLGFSVGGFVYLLREVQHLKTTCSCGSAHVRRDAVQDLAEDVSALTVGSSHQLSANVKHARDKRNLPPFDVLDEVPVPVSEDLGEGADGLREFFLVAAGEPREVEDDPPAGDPPLRRTKRGGGGKKGRGKKGSPGLKAAHIQGNAGGPVPVDAENVDRFGPERRFKFKDGKVNHWKTASWMNKPEYLSYIDIFYLDPDGSLRVTEAGLYFVYSQVYYYDGTHAFLSHIVKENGEREPFLQCIQSPVNESRKYNTCFTAGVFHLDEGDQIVVELQQNQGVVDMSPDTTFFGLMKIAEPVAKRTRHSKNKKKNKGSSK